MTPIWQIASFDSHWRLGEQKIRITWEEIELINAYQQGLMTSICIFSIYTLQEWQNCDDVMIRHPTDNQGLFSPWALSSNWCVGPSPLINHSNPTIILTTQIISTTQIWITSTNTLPGELDEVDSRPSCKTSFGHVLYTHVFYRYSPCNQPVQLGLCLAFCAHPLFPLNP